MTQQAPAIKQGWTWLWKLLLMVICCQSTFLQHTWFLIDGTSQRWIHYTWLTQLQDFNSREVTSKAPLNLVWKQYGASLRQESAVFRQKYAVQIYPFIKDSRMSLLLKTPVTVILVKWNGPGWVEITVFMEIFHCLTIRLHLEGYVIILYTVKSSALRRTRKCHPVSFLWLEGVPTACSFASFPADTKLLLTAHLGP